jgi:predicted GNAT family N-acyltransferase
MLHAQASAVGFYRRSGWQLRGPVFEEAGIAHQEMVLALN